MTTEEYNEDFAHGFYSIPDAEKRAAMSVLQLAEEMVKHEEGSPQYIVLSHELNLKLAKLQAKATLSAGWAGAVAAIIAAILSFALGYFVGTSPTKELAKVIKPATIVEDKQLVSAPANKSAYNQPNKCVESDSLRRLHAGDDRDP